jgi:hypothetical protein
MKKGNNKIIKISIIVISCIIITTVALILLISPITKYLVEKYDEKYLGRQITMGWIYLNPFTGYVHISDLKIYESKSLPSLQDPDSIFFSAKGVSANFAMLKLLSKTIEISEITLDRPVGIIIQKNKELNFSDLIKLFTPEKPRTTPSSVHFNILKIKIENGTFHYREEIAPINYFIKEVNLESSGKCWNADTMAIKFSFASGPGKGSAKGTILINFHTMDYRLAAVVHKYDLNIIEQYLKDLMNYGSFSANLDADLRAEGNFREEENITAVGFMSINDFHFGKSPEDDYASFDKLVLAMNEVSPKNHKYLFDSVSLSHPCLKYELYDYLDNVQRMFGKNGSNIAEAKANPTRFNLILKIADYIKVIVRNFLQSYYKVNRLAIYNGDITFNDFSISEKFSAGLNRLTIIADSIDKNHNRLEVSLKSGIKPYGNINVTLSINPKKSGDFDLHYHLQRLPASLFNPYLVTYTSFPLDRGTIEFTGTWHVQDGMIQSLNHLVIIDPRVSGRIRNKDKKWLPMPLMMSLIREEGNIIDYEIPISGNLKNPDFHLGHQILVMIGNFFDNPSPIPYKTQVKHIESEIKEILTMKWDMRQSSLLPDQEKFVDKLVDFLKKNTDASITVYPVQYAEKEKEYIRFYEAKKKYFLLSGDKNSHVLNEGDSLKIDKMSVKDPLFVHYLDKQVGDTMLFTIEEKCDKYIGPAMINARFRQLNKDREDAFMSPFIKKGLQNRVKIHSGENNLPYNGFSFYKIAYKGELPKSLIKAYKKMNELKYSGRGEDMKKLAGDEEAYSTRH